MVVAYVFIVIAVLGMLYDYRKAVIALAPLQFILVMFDFPGMPVTSFEIISVLVFFLFFCFTKSSDWRGLFRYPFMGCVVLTIISVVGTNYFVAPHWPTATLRFISAYIFPVILWSRIQEKEDFKFLLKVMVLFAFTMSCYILAELVMGRNPYIESIIDNGMANGNVWNYTEVRFGVKRCQGFLSTPASSGFVLGLLSVLIYVVSSAMGKYRKYMALLVGLFSLCTLLSGTRSVIAAACVAWIIIVKNEALQPRYMLLKVILVMILLAAIGPYFMEIIDSFVNTDNVQGSNSEMRLNQMLIALYYWANSPIWGNGTGFIWDFVKSVDVEIYGAESIWFQLLVDMGLVGAVAYLSCVLNVMKPFVKKHKMWLFIPLGFMAGKTLSTILGVDVSLLFVCGIILIKYMEFYENDDEDEVGQDLELDVEKDEL